MTKMQRTVLVTLLVAVVLGFFGRLVTPIGVAVLVLTVLLLQRDWKK